MKHSRDETHRFPSHSLGGSVYNPIISQLTRQRCRLSPQPHSHLALLHGLGWFMTSLISKEHNFLLFLGLRLLLYHKGRQINWNHKLNKRTYQFLRWNSLDEGFRSAGGTEPDAAGVVPLKTIASTKNGRSRSCHRRRTMGTTAIALLELFQGDYCCCRHVVGCCCCCCRWMMTTMMMMITMMLML